MAVGISSIGSTTAASYSAAAPAAGKSRQTQAQDLAQQRQLEQLKRMDAQVRAHEQAHLRAGGNLVSAAAQYSYIYGPDGKAYASGGEVRIDVSPEKDPAANISKGQRIQAAARAPVDPSPQDYSVAAQGAQLEAQGRREALQVKAEGQVPAAGSNVDTYA